MKVVDPTITVTLIAYSSGDVIGGKITLTDVMDLSGGSAILDQIIMRDLDNQKPVGKWYIFDSDPTVATLTDNGAISFSTDISKVIAVVDVASGDWHSTNSIGIGVKDNMNKMVKASGSKSLYAAYVTTSTPTFTVNSRFQARFVFRKGTIAK